MKKLFAATFVCLLLATAGTVLMMPDVRSPVPVIYWVTDPNPARDQQIELFHRWLIKTGRGEQHVLSTMNDVRRFKRMNWSPSLRAAIQKENPDAAKLWPGPVREPDLPLTIRAPLCELRLDTANRQVAKQVIQGVSRVGGDIMDIWSGSGDMFYFDDMGLLHDATADAKRLGYGTDQTWPAMEPELTIPTDGGRRQMMFPCNVCTNLFWVNAGTFRKYGQPLPPMRWTFEEFERRGKAFVEAANKGRKRRDVFFAMSVSIDYMFRSVGVSKYNETLTACALDDPRYVRCMKLIEKWTDEDHILPSRDDIQSVSTQHGYAGSTLQLFNSGNIGMFLMGRYALIQLRKFGALELSVSEPPHGGFPNSQAATRAAGVYAGSKRKDLAVLFQAFLASEDYNMQIVDDADAHPPNPKYAERADFERPPKYPNEWGVHERFSQTLRTIAIGGSHSPFVLPRVANRVVYSQRDEFTSGRMTAEEAARTTAEGVGREIKRTLEEKPALKPAYDKLVKIQKEIDARVAVWHQIDALESQGRDASALRAMAKKIPLDWIKNVFHRRYYARKGWIE